MPTPQTKEPMLYAEQDGQMVSITHYATPGAAIRVLRMGGYSVPGVPAMTDEEKDKAARAEADRVFAETVTDPAGLEWLLTP